MLSLEPLTLFTDISSIWTRVFLCFPSNSLTTETPEYLELTLIVLNNCVAGQIKSHPCIKTGMRLNVSDRGKAASGSCHSYATQAVSILLQSPWLYDTSLSLRSFVAQTLLDRSSILTEGWSPSPLGATASWKHSFIALAYFINWGNAAFVFLISGFSSKHGGWSITQFYFEYVCCFWNSHSDVISACLDEVSIHHQSLGHCEDVG